MRETEIFEGFALQNRVFEFRSCRCEYFSIFFNWFPIFTIVCWFYFHKWLILLLHYYLWDLFLISGNLLCYVLQLTWNILININQGGKSWSEIGLIISTYWQKSSFLPDFDYKNWLFSICLEWLKTKSLQQSTCEYLTLNYCSFCTKVRFWLCIWCMHALYSCIWCTNKTILSKY